MSSSRKDTVYRFIQEYLQRRGFPPTLREIAADCGISAASALAYVEWLTEHGYITRREGAPRTIRILDAAQTRQHILSYLHDIIERSGYPPSLEEIAAACHLHRSAVRHYLHELREQRLISFTDRHTRSIRLLTPNGKVG